MGAEEPATPAACERELVVVQQGRGSAFGRGCAIDVGAVGAHILYTYANSSAMQHTMALADVALTDDNHVARGVASERDCAFARQRVQNTCRRIHQVRPNVGIIHACHAHPFNLR